MAKKTTKSAPDTPRRKNHRKSVVLFAVFALVLVVPTIILTRASAGTDERVARWFLSGVDIKKVAAETKKEQQYLLMALGVGSASFVALCTAILFEAKHIKQVRGALQEADEQVDSIPSDRDA